MFPDEETVTFTPKDENAVAENHEQQNDAVVENDDGGNQHAEMTQETTEERPQRKADPLQKRIDDLTKKRHEAERRAAEAEAKLKALEKPSEGTERHEIPDVDKLVSQRAEQLVAEREYNARMNAWNNAGIKEYGKESFYEKANTLASYGALERPDFMQIVVDPDLVEDGHKVVAALADDPEEAMRILSLPPVAMSAALVRYADKIAKPTPKAKPVTKAPDPIKPISGTAKASDEPTDSDSDEEWFRKREAAVAARKRSR